MTGSMSITTDDASIRDECSAQLGRQVEVRRAHVSLIRPGDTVFHEGKVRTVCASNLKRDPFMGHTLFGDSYMIGYRPVHRVVMPCAA